MINQLMNLMRMNAQALTQYVNAAPRIGLIDSYDPNYYCVKVLFQPDDQISGWLPIFSPWVGNQWGFFTPPTPGDMALVLFQDNSYEAGIVICLGFSDTNKPLPVPSGEAWLVHQTGSYIKLENNGNIYINGNVFLTGSLTATGDVLDQSGTNVNNMRLMRSIYNTHTHGGIFAGGSNTNIPNQPE